MKQHLLHLATAGFSVILGASHGERDPPCHAAERKHERQRAKSKNHHQFFFFCCCKTKGKLCGQRVCPITELIEACCRSLISS